MWPSTATIAHRYRYPGKNVASGSSHYREGSDKPLLYTGGASPGSHPSSYSPVHERPQEPSISPLPSPMTPIPGYTGVGGDTSHYALSLISPPSNLPPLMSVHRQIPEIRLPSNEDYGGDDADSVGPRPLPPDAIGSTLDYGTQSRSVTREQDDTGLGLTHMELQVVTEYADGFHSNL